MAKILRRERLVPNIHILEVHAPEIADKCQPGQFVIIMPDEKGERIPLTIADWDKKKGSITSIFMVVGTSTHKLSLLNTGDEVPVFVGPLGLPTKIEKYGTVLCAGGCFGIAAIYPVARALKEAGNKIITLLDHKDDQDVSFFPANELYVIGKDASKFAWWGGPMTKEYDEDDYWYWHYIFRRDFGGIVHRPERAWRILDSAITP